MPGPTGRVQHTHQNPQPKATFPQEPQNLQNIPDSLWCMHNGDPRQIPAESDPPSSQGLLHPTHRDVPLQMSYMPPHIPTQGPACRQVFTVARAIACVQGTEQGSPRPSDCSSTAGSSGAAKASSTSCSSTAAGSHVHHFQCPRQGHCGALRIRTLADCGRAVGWDTLSEEERGGEGDRGAALYFSGLMLNKPWEVERRGGGGWRARVLLAGVV